MIPCRFQVPIIRTPASCPPIRIFGQHWIHPWCAWELSYHMMANLMYLKIVNFDQEKCTTREQKTILLICTTMTWHCYLEEVRPVFFFQQNLSFFL